MLIKNDNSKNDGKRLFVEPCLLPDIVINERMKAKRDDLIRTCTLYSHFNQCSYLLYDIYNDKYISGSSFFKNLLLFPAISETDPENTNRIPELTHPDYLFHLSALKTTAINFLINLPAEHRQEFRIIFSRLVKAKNGGYICMMHNVSVAVLDDKSTCWLLMEIIERYPELDSGKRNFISIFNMLPYEFIQPADGGCRCLKQELSEREFEIVLMLAKKMKRKEIADTLFISIGTVDSHCDNIRLKIYICDMDKINFLMPHQEENNLEFMNNSYSWKLQD